MNEKPYRIKSLVVRAYPWDGRSAYPPLVGGEAPRAGDMLIRPAGRDEYHACPPGLFHELYQPAGN